jgi:hypothetical protein
MNTQRMSIKLNCLCIFEGTKFSNQTAKIMKVVFISLLLFVGTLNILTAQEIQWAKAMEPSTDKYMSKNNNILGPPNASFYGNPSPAGTIVIKKDLAYLSIAIEPQYVSQILILESNDPGNIYSVEIIDEAFHYTKLYRNSTAACLNYADNPVSYALSNFIIPKTSKKVTTINIRFNKWSKAPEIDAIGVSDGEKIITLADIIKKYQTDTSLVTPKVEDVTRVDFVYALDGVDHSKRVRDYILYGSKDGVNLYYEYSGDYMYMKAENTNSYEVSITMLPTYKCRSGAGMMTTETISAPQQTAYVKGSTTATGDEKTDLVFPACKKAVDDMTILWKVERTQ